MKYAAFMLGTLVAVAGCDVSVRNTPETRRVEVNRPVIDPTPGTPDTNINITGPRGRHVDVDIDRGPGVIPKVDVDVNRRPGAPKVEVDVNRGPNAPKVDVDVKK